MALVVVLPVVCCCFGYNRITGSVSAWLFGADRPDLHNAAVTAARTTAEREIERVLAVPKPPGATKVGESQIAACYPGSHSLKINDDFDNVCLSRRTLYFRVRTSTLSATLAATHQQLVRGAWWARRDGAGQRHSLIYRELTVDANSGQTAKLQSLTTTIYDRGDDHLEFMFGPADPFFVARLTSWQTINAAVWNPYWNDTRLLDDATLRAPLDGADGGAVLAVAAQRVWFRNGNSKVDDKTGP